MTEFKFIACSDIHIRKTTPIARKDLFYSSHRRKLAWLFKLAQDNNAAIVCGGDVFDTVSIPHYIIEDIVSLALRYDVQLLTVYGQHDLRYHVYSSYKNTPLAILLTALHNKHLDIQPFVNDVVAIQGASWGRPIPDVIPGKLNILATHRMVTENGGLWEGHTDFKTGNDLLNLTKYDIIVSGDNHKSFICEKDSRFVVNSGSFARTTTLQIEYEPRVVLFTVKDSGITYEWIKVPIREHALVFKEEVIEEYHDKLALTQEQLQAFTTQLNSYKMEKPDFMYNLQEIKRSLVNTGIVSILDKIALKVGQKIKVS